MDESPRPTAAELGISDAAYERIVDDLQRRHEARGAPTPEPRSPTRPARRVSHRLAMGVIAGLVAVALLPRVFAAAPHEPAYEFRQTNGTHPVT
jgi:hypothetical protein